MIEYTFWELYFNPAAIVLYSFGVIILSGAYVFLIRDRKNSTDR